MKISVKKFKDEAIDFTLSTQDPAMQWCGEALTKAYADIQLPTTPLPYEGHLHLQKTGETVDLSGKISFDVTAACNRCLEPFTQPITMPLRITFLPDRLVQKEEPDSDSEEMSDEVDMSVWIYHNEEINLADVIYENAVLSIPLRFVCKSDCKGLCPSCGANLNHDLCACKETRVDPRFAMLKEWKGK